MIKSKKNFLCVIAFTIITLLCVLSPSNLQAASVKSVYDEWNSNTAYVGGDMVTYNSQNYKAKWWTKGDKPDTTDVWDLISPLDKKYSEWNNSNTYVGGDMVTYNNTIYQAKWWTKGETPGNAIVWLKISKTDPIEPNDPIETADPIETTNPSKPNDPISDDFKVVGYYPSWQPAKINTIQYNNLTHINYAFAIPTSDGSLLPLENADSATQIIKKAHENGVKVLLAVGGWSYNNTILESTFMSATSSPEKIQKFGDAIVAMAKKYGFDGVDIDWEHPRADGNSKNQYENLMVYLSGKLKQNNMLLTAAVLSGVTPQGVIYWDAQAQTDKVISVVDWFNVMAYDGGDGPLHSSYDFAVNCGKYWINTRKMPSQKVVLGVPFYGRPSWASYADILASNPNAYSLDVSMINGMQAYYNGIPTITAKTEWACENAGGIMMWELSQDTTDSDKSLLNAIGKTVRKIFN
jgi:GH18 family chitinase/chitodextrinase